MNSAMPRAAEVVLGLLLTGLSVKGATAAEGSLPDAAAVMQNVLRRAEAEGKADPAAGYSYEKHSQVEELDAEGKPTRTTDQTYTVFPIGGVPYSRLVKVQNRSLTPREMREQDRKEAEFRKKVGGPDAEKAAKANHQDLDPALVARFDFQVERRTLFGDRPTLVLSFRPKANRGPEKTIGDKILGRLAGTLWVDEQEWEIARLKLHLTDDLSLGWFGMVGSLRKLDFDLELVRLPDGAWLGRKQTLEIAGRKVFSAMRSRTTEESTSFHKMPGNK